MQKVLSNICLGEIIMMKMTALLVPCEEQGSPIGCCAKPSSFFLTFFAVVYREKNIFKWRLNQ